MDSLNKGQKGIRRQIYSLVRGYEGGIGYNDAWGMSPLQRNEAIEFLNQLAEKQEQMMRKQRPL